MTQLAVRQDTGLSVQGAPLGLENDVERKDLIIPRAKLLQALSPEVSEGNGKAGQIINSLTKEVLPAEFLPCIFFKQWICFNPRDSKHPNFNPLFGPGDVVYQSLDPNDERVKVDREFGPDGERPKATEFISFVSYFPGVQMPVVVSFANTSYKAGKQLLTMTKFGPKEGMWKRKFKLGSKTEKNTNIGATYHVLTVEPAGNASDEDAAFAKGVWESLSPKRSDLNVHTEDNDN
jgi:hypothetical protein